MVIYISGVKVRKRAKIISQLVLNSLVRVIIIDVSSGLK